MYYTSLNGQTASEVSVSAAAVQDAGDRSVAGAEAGRGRS